MAAHTKSVARHSKGAAYLPLVLAALVWVGFNLRSPLLEVPPVLARIQADLHLSYTSVGLLNALPPLIMGAGAYPAVYVIRRLGSRTAIIIGLAVMTLAACLRAFAPGAVMLFLLTAVMSGGIALGQTTVPLVVRERFPGHIGQATAAYSTGLMVGEICAAAFTAPWLLNTLSGGDWRQTFIWWSIPALLSLILWWVAIPPMLPTSARNAARAATEEAASIYAPAPTLRTWRGWQVSLLLGCGSMLFFGLDTWIPIYYHSLGRTDAAAALTALTVAQLPSSLFLTAYGQHFAGRPSGFIGAGLLATLAMIGWFVAPPSWYLVLAALLGMASAALFILGLSLPPLLGRGHSVAQISGMMLTISYTSAFVGPFLGGVLWDLFKIPLLAFLPILLASAATIVLGAFMPVLGHTKAAA